MQNGEHGFDLVVVGAGPGGMGAAYYAARLGLRVALLEQERLPRDRVCGDGMLAQTVSEMERLGLGDWLLEPHHGVIEGFSIRTKTARFDEPLPPDPRGSRGYIVRRQEFEPKIMQRVLSTGATLHEGFEARRLLRSPAGTVRGLEAVAAGGETVRFEAPLVVVAGGFGGGLEGQQNKNLAAMVVSRQYFADLPEPGSPGRGYLHIWYTGEISDLGVGYGRIFYLGDGSANVGVAVYGRNLPKEPAARDAAIRRLHEGFLQHPEVTGLLSSATPEEPVTSRTFSGGGYGVTRHEAGLLYVGDTGGTSHPVSGEGIGFALEAGRLAAGWAAEAHGRHDYSAALLSGYAKQLGNIQSLRQPSTHALVALVNRLPHLELMEPVFKRCEKDAGLRHTVSEALAGNTGASALLRKRPVVVARAVGEAVAGLASRAGSGTR